MIARLRGVLSTLGPERVLVDVAGVGYEVHVSTSTLGALENTAASGAVEVLIHTHVREDAIVLFGFATALEKQLFEKLILVSGVGPKLARAVLSGLEPVRLARAISQGDATLLATISGVGKKTAERLVLELRDVVAGLAVAPTPSEDSASLPPGDEDVVGALVNLGYKRFAAERAVFEARRDAPNAVFGELFRASLGRLSRL